MKFEIHEKLTKEEREALQAMPFEEYKKLVLFNLEKQTTDHALCELLGIFTKQASQRLYNNLKALKNDDTITEDKGTS